VSTKDDERFCKSVGNHEVSGLPADEERSEGNSKEDYEKQGAADVRVTPGRDILPSLA
jgi:hypothetical protein